MNPLFKYCMLRSLICSASLAATLIAQPVWAEEEESAPEKQTSEEKQAQKEADLKADFPFTFNDISSNLVIIECKSSIGKSAGSGFIAKMDGKTYIFTNQHVIMGADKIDFATVTGEELHPLGVELSVTRDIVRLPIDDRDDALTISPNVLMGMPLAVFGNSEGGGVATELYGNVTGVGAELVEVDAEFVAGNSGSPVIGKDKEVIGIASYVRFSRPSRMTENTRFENKTRRFCYRLTDVRWAPVRWKQYNATNGKTYQETEALVDTIFDVVNNLYDHPFASVSENYSDSDLATWSSQHNRAVGSSGTQRRRDVGKSTEALSHLCQRRASSLEMKLQNRDLTGFLREEFEGYMYALRYASESIDYFNTKLPGM